MKERILKYILSIISEADGTGSATRVLAGISVLSTICLVTYVTVINKHLPDLSGASLFLSAGFSGYAVNKVSECFKRDDKSNS
jgi:hypothetical protein